MAGNANYFASKVAAKVTAKSAPASSSFGAPSRSRPAPASHMNAQQFNITVPSGFTPRTYGKSYPVGLGATGLSVPSSGFRVSAAPKGVATSQVTPGGIGGPIWNSAGANAVRAKTNAPGSGASSATSPSQFGGKNSGEKSGRAARRAEKRENKFNGNNARVLRAMTGTK